MENKNSDEYIIAKTIYNEARGEGDGGMICVGATMINRYNLDRSYMGGQDWEDICKKGYDGAKGADPNPKKDSDQAKIWKKCLETFAPNVIAFNIVDTTGGSTHFHTDRDGFKHLEKKTFVYVKKIGSHYFFKES
jgi:spore germination cell wall hydrolase CwlJ-like protein